MPLLFWDDETFFELGLSRQTPILCGLGDQPLTNSEDILWQIDEYFPELPNLVNGVINKDAWQALLDWRRSVDSILSRLLAPALLSYKDIAEDENSVAQYKQSVSKKYGMSAEALANDRYASYEQFAKLTRFVELAKHLSKNRFYMEQLSIADMVITADLYSLQCLDGVSLPIDFLYYLKRVEEACNINLQEGLIINL